MLKLKVCGMRDNTNITALSEIKPDFIGFIFHKKSSRNVSEPIQTDSSKNCFRVGVFVNETQAFIFDKIKKYHLDYVQLHGAESPEFCNDIREQGIKIIKAFNISDDFNFSNITSYEPLCDYFLFDAFGKRAGGNGITFNWRLLNKYNGKTAFLLSGGIDATMANQIKELKHSKFAGIDINSGFEIEPAFKNIEKIKAFKNELYS